MPPPETVVIRNRHQLSSANQRTIISTAIANSIHKLLSNYVTGREQPTARRKRDKTIANSEMRITIVAGGDVIASRFSFWISAGGDGGTVGGIPPGGLIPTITITPTISRS